MVQADAVAPQAWRNGGGQTRELLAWPAAADWQLRISRADIAADGPFSAFEGVDRWFTVLEGAGVTLRFTAGHAPDAVLRKGYPPLHFDGALAPACTLLDGPTQDLNLMARRGRGTMKCAQAGVAWDAADSVCGLYTTGPGVWRTAGHEHGDAGGNQGDGEGGDDRDSAARKLPAHSLLWCVMSAPALWTFVPDLPGSCAWWLGYTPESA